MHRQRAAHQGAIEKLVAAFTGGLSDQLTAMASGAMGGSDVVGMVGVVLGSMASSLLRGRAWEIRKRLPVLQGLVP